MTAARIVHLTLPPYLHVRGEGRTSMYEDENFTGQRSVFDQFRHEMDCANAILTSSSLK